MASKRESESIGEFLRSRYPSHRFLENGMSNLANAGYKKLDELQNVNYRSLRRYISALFCIALRDYMKLDSSDPVEDDCTLDMPLHCTVKTVKLRQENEIPELPAQFSPMFDSESEEELEEPTDDKEDQLLDDLTLVEEAHKDLPAPAQPGLLELNMYVFSSQRSRAALEKIWCKKGGTSILVRPSYTALERKVQGYWDRGVNAVLLLGVPGIGKTGFIIAMLLSLMEQRKVVAFQSTGEEVYLFEPQPVVGTPLYVGHGYTCLKLRNKSVLHDPELYYLVDGKLPNVPMLGCKALLAATPKLLNFLPVWSAAEIALAGQEIFDPSLPGLEHENNSGLRLDGLVEARQHLTLDVVKERYSKWGGTARFVLEKPHVDLDTIVRGLQSVQQTVEMTGKQVADGDHPSHKMVHQRVKPRYNSYEYMFASPYLVEACRRKLKESNSGALRLFLSFKGLAAHGVNGCKGYVFQHEFKSLASGIQRFKVRQVHANMSLDDAGGVEVFDFGDPVDVDKVEELPFAATVNRIIWPASRIEETIDAVKIVRVPGQLDVLEVYQATLSSARHAHGLKYGAMIRVMHKFRIPPHRTNLYIVTTSERYLDAGYQNWSRSKNLVLKDTRILIRQYIVDSGA